jgi:hypothetical protein
MMTEAFQSLDEDLGRLKRAYNRAIGVPKFLFLTSPT